MRADRLLAILLLLQTRGRTTAADLAERLEVSERTIYRDLDALSAAGVPVYAERGPGGGCSLPENYRTNLTGLNEDEVRTLFMGAASGPLADLGLGKSQEDAMLKLLATLPSAHRRDAEIARQRIHLDAAGWNRTDEQVPHLMTVQQATWQQRRLRVSYRRGSDGDRVERLVAPYGLVAKASIWYLVAAAENGDVRVFRVSRMQGVELTDEYFERPADFDLAAYWKTWCEEFKANLPRYPVMLRVSPQAINIIPQLLGESVLSLFNKAEPADADGWRTFQMQFESREVACARLLGLGTQIEVVAPQELRDYILELVQNVARLYSRSEIKAPEPEPALV